MILWLVITHKDDFCERQPSPAKSTNFSDDLPLFANANVIVLSCCVFLCSLVFRYEEVRQEGRRCTQEGGEFKSFSFMSERPRMGHPSFKPWRCTDRDPWRGGGVPGVGMASSYGTTRTGARQFPPRHPREPRKSNLQHVEKQSLQPHPWLQRQTARKDRYGSWLCSSLQKCGLDFFCQCFRVGLQLSWQ